MKNKYLIYLLLIAATTISCSDWTDAKALDFFESPSDEYYAALREYKESDHQMSFGWFANVTGLGASLVNTFVGLPDSLDIVSIWSGTESPEYFKDMYICQKIKGTRVLTCKFAQSVPEEFGWDGSDPSRENSVMVKAVQDFAVSICEDLLEKGYDGLDIDYEPTVGGPEAKGNLSLNEEAMGVWIEKLGEYLGPKSGTDKLLIIDGEIDHRFLKNHGSYFNYFISQAYRTLSVSTLESRLSRLINSFGSSETDPLTEEEVTRKFFVTENFEAVDIAMSGGYNFTDPYGNKMKSLEGMARWKPQNGFRKGGIGTYHMEAEYPTNPEYKHLRNAIQIMNPSSKTLVKY